MAKAKSKNDIKLNINKNKNNAVKIVRKTTPANKKSRPVKKKIEVLDEVKKKEIQEVEIVKKPTKKTTTTNNVVNSKELSSEEILLQKKERNRKKYQNQQKKYQINQKAKVKKKIEVEDKVEEQKKIKEEHTVKEEDLVKKVKQKETIEKEKEKERKEKRKTNRKSIVLTQTLTTIKEKSVTTINTVKDKADDKHIPVGKTITDKKNRSKRLIKEAIVYAIILTVINVLCIVFVDSFNFLRLFDVKALNIVVTILISLIFNFFVAFMIDYFVTIVWLKNKCKKKVGEHDGDNGVNKEEYREDIKDKEGE